LTAIENVQMALLSRDRRLFAIWRRAEAYRQDEALGLLDQVGMAAQTARPCGELAYGDIKRVELAIALAHAPRLLLMDEPTAGMAPAERIALMALVRDLAAQRGIGVLFTEHNMDVVFANADRIIVLARGRLIAQGSPAEVRAHADVQEVYFGAPGVSHIDSAFPAGALRVSTARPPEGARHHSSPSAAAPAGASVLLQARGLGAWYGGAQVLRDIGLEVRRGEVVALMGRNGAGKSTTLKALVGMVHRRSGAIRFLGQDITGSDAHVPAQRGLGFVPEDRRIFTDLTVLENLRVGQQPARRWPDGSAAPRWTVERLFHLFPSLAAMPARRALHMSGGEQQMLAIARTLMGNPLLLLLDEPSEGVAPIIVGQLVRMVLELKAQGVSVLLSEQNMAFSAAVSDRAYVLEKGEVRFQGGMAELQANEDVRRSFLGL
jgi:branched-chain amino acid transport system ATP-binding protein